MAFTEETFGECFHKAAIMKSNGNVRLMRSSSKQRSLKMLWKNRKYYSKKLFSLNSGVMDDNHDTYKTANIKIIQLF
jgi:hypothetical protein